MVTFFIRQNVNMATNAILDRGLPWYAILKCMPYLNVDCMGQGMTCTFASDPRKLPRQLKK